MKFRVGVLSVALIGGVASAARAEQLVAGHPLLQEPASLAAAADDPWSADMRAGETGAAGLTLQFTPRNPLSLLTGSIEPSMTEPGEIQLNVSRDEAMVDRFASLGSAGMAATPSAGGALEIGGAFHWSDWTVGSGYARAPLFGGDADLFSATVGYGPLEARLSYGQAQRAQSDNLDVMMLSTDLAAWSWLTLETDLAVGAGQEQSNESLAVGRVGVRFNF